MQDNMIYEINNLMDTEHVKKDLSEAQALFVKFFQERYINQLKNAVNSKRLDIESNPPREIRLMQALKAFASPQGQKKIDEFINMMGIINTVTALQKPLMHTMQNGGPNNHDSSIHEDGVYDIDEFCMQQKTQPIMALSVMLMLMKML